MPDKDKRDLTIGELFDKKDLRVIENMNVMCESCRWVGTIRETVPLTPLEEFANEEGEVEEIRIGCPQCRSDVSLIE